MAAGGSGADKGGDQPEQPSFPYTHLWVGSDGETHITEAHFKGFETKKYADTEQWVLEGPPPTKVVFTELPPGNEQDWHSCPAVQYVTTLSGSWYVKTTDGTVREFKAGETLFQDDVADSPGAVHEKYRGHYSGVVGDQPCRQLVVQVDRKPEVDKPGSL